MRDQMDARVWNDLHSDFSASVDGGLRKLLRAFETLARINFDAPWTETRARNHCR